MMKSSLSLKPFCSSSFSRLSQRKVPVSIQCHFSEKQRFEMREKANLVTKYRQCRKKLLEGKPGEAVRIIEEYKSKMGYAEDGINSLDIMKTSEGTFVKTIWEKRPKFGVVKKKIQVKNPKKKTMKGKKTEQKTNPKKKKMAGKKTEEKTKLKEEETTAKEEKKTEDSPAKEEKKTEDSPAKVVKTDKETEEKTKPKEDETTAKEEKKTEEEREDKTKTKEDETTVQEEKKREDSPANVVKTDKEAEDSLEDSPAIVVKTDKETKEKTKPTGKEGENYDEGGEEDGGVA